MRESEFSNSLRLKTTVLSVLLRLLRITIRLVPVKVSSQMAMMKVRITLWILIVSVDNLSGIQLPVKKIQKDAAKKSEDKEPEGDNCNLIYDRDTCTCNLECAECFLTKSTEQFCQKSNLCAVYGDSKLKDDKPSTNIPEDGIRLDVKQCRPQCLNELNTKFGNVSANGGSKTRYFFPTNSSCNIDPNTDSHSNLTTYLTIGGAVIATIIIILIIVINVIVRVFRKRKQKCTPDKYDDPFDRVIADLDYHYYDDPAIFGCDNVNLNCDEDEPNPQKEVSGRGRKLPDPPKEVNPVYTEMD